MRALARSFFAISLCLVAAPLAASEAKLAAALGMFNEAALWRDNMAHSDNRPQPIAGIIRFNEPIRIFLGRTSSNSLPADAERLTREAAGHAGVAVSVVETVGNANFRFDFFADNATPPGVPPTGCGTATDVRATGLVSVTLYIRISRPDCLAHEILHGFGLVGHPHEFDTLLSYKRPPGQRERFTELDRLALRTLYRSGLTVGTFHLPALLVARQFMAEELGLVAKGGDTSALARPVLERAVERLRAAADPGSRAVQHQLGIAYAFGQFVARDHVQAAHFWTLAANQRHPEALFQLGMALQAGRGVAVDAPASRRRLREASSLGHGPAAFAVAQAYRDGVGGWPNALEAYAFFDVAARRNVASAAAARDALFANFDEPTRARAVAHARQFPTSP
jgi:hypothetical protein